MQQYKRPFVSPRCPLFRHKNRRLMGSGSWERGARSRDHKASWQNHKKPVLLGCTVPGAMSAKDCPAANLSRAPTKKKRGGSGTDLPTTRHPVGGRRATVASCTRQFPLGSLATVPMACVVSLWLSLRVLVFGSSAHGERDWAQADLSEKDIDYWALPAR